MKIVKAIQPISFVCAAMFLGLLALGVAGVTVAGVTFLDGAASAQSGGTVPGNSVGNISDSELWHRIRRGERGTVSLPDRQAGVMIQSEGDNWRAVRNGPVSFYGAWLMAMTLLVLLLFFLVRGRIRIESGLSGREVERFNGLERFTHWMTAGSFVVLGLSGLNMLYGRYVFIPLIGPETFSTLTYYGKLGHNFLGFAFMAGLVLIVLLWVRDNMPSRADWDWIKRGGGMFFLSVHPPAHKFNAGQKFIFWLTVLVGASISFSGISLMFPFTFEPFAGTFAVMNMIGFDLPTTLTSMQEMQLTQLWHTVLSMAMIAVILAHIYIGWIGMEGAYDAMGHGYVDENWAREHHSLWV
ncbi:MAG: formate dehydrogenase subunit gamma, partial [Rhodospirillales bacterium]|nr:formate dehydrogenase subunit gamma [Rhodospirillales bacterium]